MRSVPFVIALALVSSVSILAQQTAPPPATSKPGAAKPAAAAPTAPTPATVGPATAPSAARPSSVRPPAVSPDALVAPSVPPVPSIAPPAVGFAPQGAPPTPRPGQPGPNTPAPSAAAQAAPSTSWQNIKLDVTITDSLTSDVQAKKTVSMLILDGRNGQVRSTNEGYINIDASPAIRPDGRVYLRLTVEYLPYLTAQQSQQTGNTVGRTVFSESLAVIVSDGKPITLSQAADPRGDRKVSLEVTASVIK